MSDRETILRIIKAIGGDPDFWGDSKLCRVSLEKAEAVLREYRSGEIAPGKSAVRMLLTAAKETVSVLRSLNGYERVCRELVGTKVNGDFDLAAVLSNVMRRLDNAAESVEASLSPKPLKGSDFETWLGETFYGRDVDLKIEAIPHAHVLNYDQAIRLASFVWGCMELKRPPWWSAAADGERLRQENASLVAVIEYLWQHAEPSVRDTNIRDQVACVLSTAGNAPRSEKPT